MGRYPSIRFQRPLCSAHLCAVMPRGERGRSGVSNPAHLSPPSAADSSTDTAAGLSRQSRTPLLSFLSLPLCPAHPGGLLSSPARANPRLGVSRASRFLVLRKEELGVGVGQRRQKTGGQSSPESRRSAERRGEGSCEGGGKTPTHNLASKKTSQVSS